MKILLLTDIPPCKNLTAGLVLDQLCRFLPKDSLVCYVVKNRHIDAELSEDLNCIPIEYCKKPIEYAGMLPYKLGFFSSLVFESFNATVANRMIASKVISFGRKFRVDAMWCVLQGQTMIRLALPVAEGLGVPLFTQVWDPPDWWMRANRVDSFSKKAILREFARVLGRSRNCATASWAMADYFRSTYHAKATPVMPCINRKWAVAPASALHDNNDFIIGMAGQIYSGQEWDALVEALNSLNWQLFGKQVRIRFLGRYANLRADSRVNLEYLGWATQQETIKLMSEADVLYCPYWFDREYEVEARLSFPSKLTTYLASGRPVFFHGPEYSSPGKFLNENSAAFFCHSLDRDEIVRSLEAIRDPQEYAAIARKGADAFRRNFTLEIMKEQLMNFLMINENDKES